MGQLDSEFKTLMGVHGPSKVEYDFFDTLREG